MGTNENCKIWNKQRYAGDGDENNLCFVKKETVRSDGLKMIKANTMCQDYKSISDQEDDLEDCADKVVSDGECAGGKNIFFHR